MKLCICGYLLQDWAKSLEIVFNFLNSFLFYIGIQFIYSVSACIQQSDSFMHILYIYTHI